MAQSTALSHFLSVHTTTEREAVRRDVEPYLHMSLEERGHYITAACELAAAILEGRPDREEALSRREEPHPAWAELVARHRAA